MFYVGKHDWLDYLFIYLLNHKLTSLILSNRSVNQAFLGDRRSSWGWCWFWLVDITSIANVRTLLNSSIAAEIFYDIFNFSDAYELLICPSNDLICWIGDNSVSSRVRQRWRQNLAGVFRIFNIIFSVDTVIFKLLSLLACGNISSAFNSWCSCRLCCS